MAQLAEDIVDKCKYIHPSRVEEVEQLLIKLRKHVLSNPPKNNDDNGDDSRRNKTSNEEKNIKDKERDRSEDLPPARLDDLDNYLDMLYEGSGKSEKEKEEGLKAQIKGTAMILNLCRDVMNLEQLIQNSTVMGAITRVFQEEHKKSVELTFNILRIFLAFSNFMEMHSLMANYRVGLLTMKVIEYEVKRVQHREEEKAEREAKYEAQFKAAKEEGSRDINALYEKIRRQKEKEEEKQRKIRKRHEKMLFVAFCILLNLAEDVNVEKKMIKKDLLQNLTVMLDCNYNDLLILIVTFLKKCCIFEENKEALKTMNIVDKLSKFVPCSSPGLVNISLRLLFNLSFDADLREQMMRKGLVPKLISLLKTPNFRARVLKLLYHLSSDDRCKSMVTYTDGMSILMGMVINFPQNNLPRELAALVVNLSYNPRNAELMIANRGLNHLMDRLENTSDPMLLKIIRNLTLWTFNQQQELEQPELQYKWRGLWSPHIKVLLELVTNGNHDILVEVYGCLANLSVFDLPANSSWPKLITEYNFITLFNKILIPGMAQNDLILEVIMVISSMCSDQKACDMIASSNLINVIYGTWKDKDDDTEIRLQIIHLFYKLFQFPSSRDEAMYNTRIVVDIIDCLTHKNSKVREEASKVTDIVLEHDRREEGELGQLGLQIRKKRFEGYNMHYVKQLEVTMDHDDYGYGSDIIDPRPREDWRNKLSMDMKGLGLGDSHDESWDDSGNEDSKRWS